MESKGDLDGKVDDDDDDADAKAGCKRAADSKATTKLEGAALLRAVLDYYYAEDLEQELRAFAVDRCASFDDEALRTGEFTLEHSRAHDDFKALFERKAERFIAAQGASVRAFYRAVASDMDRSTELYSGHTIAAVLNSAVKFENFYELMADARRGDFCWGMPLLQDMDTEEFLFDD